MQNFKQPGDVLDLVAPYAVVSGAGFLVDGIFAVACSDAALSAAVRGMVEGVFTLAKTSAQAWTDGQKLAWDNTNKRLDSDLSKGPCVATACGGGAANPSSTGAARLNGVGAPRANSVMGEGMPAFTSDATAGAKTYTAAEILGGVIARDPSGASRVDVLPSALLLVAACPGAKVGDLIQCLLVNGADAAETITVGAGAGGTFDTNQTAASRLVPQNASKLITIRLTNVGTGTEAYAVVM